MTLLDVQHATIYRYRRPVSLGAHRLMLRPRDSHDLRLVTTQLTCSPSATISWTHDVFGNSVAYATFAAPSETLSITSRVVVELCAPDWPVFAIATFALTYPFTYSDDERVRSGALLSPQYADPEGRLKTWAQAFVLSCPTDTLSLLKDLNAGIAGWISYQSRDDERTQGPLETLARGWGTCRDFAVLLAEAARTLGFGARIASGYLYNSDAAGFSTGGADSTHAWVEIYLPGAGWITFDPTNRVLGSGHLIRVAVARSIEQASPISGTFSGVPEDFLGLDVAVSVTRRDEQ